jgi:hypothetical protein
MRTRLSGVHARQIIVLAGWQRLFALSRCGYLEPPSYQQQVLQGPDC